MGVIPFCSKLALDEDGTQAEALPRTEYAGIPAFCSYLLPCSIIGFWDGSTKLYEAQKVPPWIQLTDDVVTVDDASSRSGIDRFQTEFDPSKAMREYWGITDVVIEFGALVTTPLIIAGADVCCCPSSPQVREQPPIRIVPKSIVPKTCEINGG
jgi:hypothetical protein